MVRYVLLGATGDLARKKIVPALARLAAEGVLGSEYEFVAASRRPWGDADYRDFVEPWLAKAGVASEAARAFLERTRYVEADFIVPSSLGSLAKEAEGALLHLATEPSACAPVIEALGRAGAFQSQESRLLLEKPFGAGGASARLLEERLRTHLPDSAIFRVDHYLGKESVRGLCSRYHARPASRILISLVERQGIEGRGAVYDAMGALQDVVQGHALEVLATCLADDAMPLPRARFAVLERLTMAPGATRIGQYRGYHAEPGVAPGSRVETAVELPLSYEGRHGPIPIRIRAGKALTENCREIRFETEDGEEVVSLAGDGAYEYLISAALKGDHEPFPSFEEIAAAWRVIDPVARLLPTLPLSIYEPGEAFFS